MTVPSRRGFSRFVLGVAIAAALAACGSSPTSPSTAPFSKTDLITGTGTDAVAGKVVTVNYTGLVSMMPRRPTERRAVRLVGWRHAVFIRTRLRRRDSRLGPGPARHESRRGCAGWSFPRRRVRCGPQRADPLRTPRSCSTWSWSR